MDNTFKLVSFLGPSSVLKRVLSAQWHKDIGKKIRNGKWVVNARADRLTNQFGNGHARQQRGSDSGDGRLTLVIFHVDSNHAVSPTHARL